ncbi:unnamed protein product [Porites evermanni]|uniref:Uncharacterized protein n=1 Tax=Porites evermanni TaxID=104178 RepID=A0ABN8ME01_9CNID|nr:unnamed protein product [Porites evermanni]
MVQDKLRLNDAKTEFLIIGTRVQLNKVTLSDLQVESLGDRAFENAAPKVWDRLPLEIRQCQSLNIFKVLLKTHLFKLAFY